jgi:hypothetical protein
MGGKVMSFVEVELTEEMKTKARGLATELGKLNNSITSGDGNLAGFYGEVAVAYYFSKKGCEVSHSNTYDYDLIVDGKTIDVKTKRCKSPPKPTYDCSVANFNTTQKCDYYLFTRVMNDTVYLLGNIHKERFRTESVFHKKGETDSNFVGGKPFRFHADCWNIRIDQLKNFNK